MHIKTLKSDEQLWIELSIGLNKTKGTIVI